jgi:hypothetical protein
MSLTIYIYYEINSLNHVQIFGDFRGSVLEPKPKKGGLIMKFGG